MSDYFFEFDIPNFVDNVDILQRIRNKYKANIQDNIYNQIDEQLDFVEYIDNKIGKCELSIAKLKNSIPYKKEDRLNDAKSKFKNFERLYPDSTHMKDAQKLLKDIEKEILTFASN